MASNVAPGLWYLWLVWFFPQGTIPTPTPQLTPKLPVPVVAPPPSILVPLIDRFLYTDDVASGASSRKYLSNSFHPKTHHFSHFFLQILNFHSTIAGKLSKVRTKRQKYFFFSFSERDKNALEALSQKFSLTWATASRFYEFKINRSIFEKKTLFPFFYIFKLSKNHSERKNSGTRCILVS